MMEKESIVKQFLQEAAPSLVWDLGANTGRFSRLASQQGIQTISIDMDPAAVERNYLKVKTAKESHLLPLLLDLTNPTPATRWQNTERDALLERTSADTIMALALIHHLAITNNLPLVYVSEFMSRLGQNLIIEFVPKEDSQVQRMLASREDIFPDYTQAGFETAFDTHFDFERVTPIEGSLRTLYLMRRRGVE
jgi:ribosomal protein L11 methylase PrmA